MAIPKTKELYDPILNYLASHGRSHISQIRKGLAAFFYIPDEEAFDRDEKPYSTFERNVNIACWDLWHAGLVLHVDNGVYELAPKTAEVLDKEDHIDRDYLNSIPEYWDYKENRNLQHDKGFVAKPCPVYKKPEYVEVKEVTLADIARLRKQDTRYANMAATGCMVLDNGKIKAVPQAVLAQDISYQEFKEQNGASEIKNAVDVYNDANGSGKMLGSYAGSTGAPPKGPERHWTKPKGPRKWFNPYPKDKDKLASAFPVTNELKKYFKDHSGDINSCMTHLLDTYNIPNTKLASLTGIDLKKIQRYKTDKNVNYIVQELAAICLVLQTNSGVFEELLRAVGIDPLFPKHQIYASAIDLLSYQTYETINKACQDNGADALFHAGMTGVIPYDKNDDKSDDEKD